MIDFLDNIDAEPGDGAAHVVPIITEIHEVNDGIDIQDNKAEDIPVLPLRNMVLFPSMTMPVSVGRDIVQLLSSANMTVTWRIQLKKIYTDMALSPASSKCWSCLTALQT